MFSRRSLLPRLLDPRPAAARQRRGVIALAAAWLALPATLVAVPPTAPAAPTAVAEPAPTPDAAVGREDWYQVEISGAPAGQVVIRERLQGDEITTETEMEISLKRGGRELTLGIATRFVESTDGTPRSAWVSQAMGQVPVETTFTFAAEELSVRSVQGDSVTESTLPPPAGPWLPPAAAQRLVARQVLAGADRFAYRTVDPASGPLPVDVVGQRLADGVALTLPDGSTVTTSRWSQLQEPGPGVESTLYLDADGRLVRSITPLLGAEMVLTLTDRRTAEGPRRAPELLVTTFVRPDRRIAAPRRARRAVYELSSARGALPELPRDGAQRVERRGSSARVEVAVAAAGPVVSEDPAPYLAASSYLNHRDPAVAALAAEALDGAGGTPAARAERLRAFVHRYLEEKDLGTGFATASEVAALKSGDCTEHSVLLAALLRAAGIPSRVVVGLLYVERFAGERDLFGYHMWTQALLDRRWVDYDALTPNRFDATHIALATSALGDGGGFVNAAAAVATLAGALEIEVLEVER